MTGYNLIKSFIRWFDSEAAPINESSKKIDWLRVIPFVSIHLGCICVVWVGWSPFALIFAVLLYIIRMFAITGFYHRYFSHKAFSTSRIAQFLFALIGATAVQRGPLWWASHHRLHHAHSDRIEDAHSPVQHGFWWSHLGWFLSEANFRTKSERIKELMQYPELRFLDRFDIIVPTLFAICIYCVGAWVEATAPELGTNGWQLLVWGFFISTVAVYHATFSVNSLAHGWGSRRYETSDYSRNNHLIALITLGEGWHNNHHHYPGAARQGFYWWELDITYYGLKVLESVGLIWGLRNVPLNIRESRKLQQHTK